MKDYCKAMSSDGFRITALSEPGGRSLNCSVCGAKFPWSETGDVLPLHTILEKKLNTTPEN